MAVREIVQYPAEVLTTPARKVGRNKLSSLPQLIQDMKDTLAHAEGVGLAAPQIGVSLRVAIALNIETEKLETYINPTITRMEGEELGEEGCLSFNHLAGLIPRATKIWVKYQDVLLNDRRAVLEGLSARIMQHEIDHLNGVTIKDRSVVELYERKPEEKELAQEAQRVKASRLRTLG